MQKIKNPFINTKDYNCFGCAPDNHEGLRMEFFKDGDEVVSEWTPNPHFQGYVNILHGGIQAALADEIAYWAVLVKLRCAAVTAKLDFHLKKPVFLDKGKIFLRAKLIEEKRRIAKVHVDLYDFDKLLCASGDIYYFVISKEESIKKFNYPEDDTAFFD